VEYAVAVDRYLDAAQISPASRRVYRVALETWGWLLVGKTPPTGRSRRNAAVPMLPLAQLEGESAGQRVLEALDRRALMVGARTWEREASILRNAAHWWAARTWISPHTEDALKRRPHPTPPTTTPAEASSPIDVRALFALQAPLREQALWHLVYESAAPVGHLLALDVSDLDLAARRTRRQARPRRADRIGWGGESAHLLRLLTIGRTTGPVFLTERRGGPRVATGDRCPYTGRARLSARRAAELFDAATRELDPQGVGWNLRDLRLAGRLAQEGDRASEGSTSAQRS
jgi:integrase/recombinase XerD